eukprot:scaffold28702_cov62-Phaeocystis_antarctica.AAC.4
MLYGSYRALPFDQLVQTQPQSGGAHVELETTSVLDRSRRSSGFQVRLKPHLVRRADHRHADQNPSGERGCIPCTIWRQQKKELRLAPSTLDRPDQTCRVEVPIPAVEIAKFASSRFILLPVPRVGPKPCADAGPRTLARKARPPFFVRPL